jgi:hypothetical protein
MVSNRVYITEDFVFAPPGATVGDVLSAYVMRGAHWWWWLVTEVDAEYRICSYGSLLPYLVGLTSHIVHKPGACPICSTLDPTLWRSTETLIGKALAEPDVRSRRVSDLPMKPLAIADVAHIDEPDLFLRLIAQDKGISIYGVLEDGVFIGVNSEQTRTMGGVGGTPSLPSF